VKSRILITSFAALPILTVPILSAPITFQSSPLIVTAGNPDDMRYATPPGSGYDGIGRLLVDRADGSVACTASLLSSGRQVLTAAHCVTDNSGLVNALLGEVTFVTGAGEESIVVSNYTVHPDWTGNVRAGADLAVLTLSRIASSRANRYELYDGVNEVGASFELAGFGLTGTGASGADRDDGIRRRGRNRIDATATGTLDRLPGWAAGSRVLLSDFDDGSARHDALGLFFNLADRGLGVSEAIPAPGDSGGPGLIGGRISTIASFGTRLARSDGITSDVDAFLNWSTGELTGFTRVSSYGSWIKDQTILVPEPRTTLLVFACAVAMILRRPRRDSSCASRSVREPVQ
jgi:hypothetical protein